jgi:hypothetical protein
MIYGSIGSISHGTLRPEDLIPTFSRELRWLVKANSEARGRFGTQYTYTEREANLVALCDEADAIENFDSDTAHEVLEQLFDALDAYAPPYCYFGATEGDGSDFGFWLCDMDNTDLPRYSDLAAVPADISECYIVNDHGNVSFASRGEDGELHSIWSIV